MANIGFTGTQVGLTTKQKEVLTGLFDTAHNIYPSVLHHGCCIGADAEAHKIADTIGMWIVLHPPTNKGKVAALIGNDTRPAKEYLARNRDIVDESEYLIACPGTMHEELRSGTWSTVRYARKKNKQITIIYPNGSVGTK